MSEKQHQTVCAQQRRVIAVNRRGALRAGAVAGRSLGLPQLLAARARANPDGSFGAARSVIMLYLHGGHPQQETFDPKPHGPSEVRGEFAAIDTSQAGIQFSEVLPRTAQIAHKLAIVRSMSHANANHVQASLPANTGHKHSPNLKSRGDFPPSETDFPPFGAVLDTVRPADDLPTWVRVGPLMRRSNGTVLHGQLPGFLGARHSSFVVDQSLMGDDVEIEAVRPAAELTAPRLNARRDLMQLVDRQRRILDDSASAANLDQFYARAFNLLASPQTRRAFDLSSESPETRARYGNTEFGQRCLLARRLAESGVPMVNVSYCHTPSDSWDTHGQHFKRTKQTLAPTLDAALTGLIGDLDDRGLLSETLVVVNAEFGRTPAINKNAGRDHWPWVYSLALAGGGTRAGVVHGASDDSASYPTESPHDPADMAATIYHLLGIPTDTTLHDAQWRPNHLVIGQAIEELVA
jgi:Protein of unknown function (DUF1501)